MSRLYEKDVKVHRDTCSVFIDNNGVENEYDSYIMLNDKSVDDFSKCIQFEITGDQMVLRQSLPFNVVVPFTYEGVKLAHSLFDKTIENMICIINIMKNGKVYKPCM